MRQPDENKFSDLIKRKEQFKLRAEQKKSINPVLGLRLFGVVGWLVAVPTVLGACLGVWLDKHYPAQHSWILSLLVAGLILGCISAWMFVAREYAKIDKDR